MRVRQPIIKQQLTSHAAAVKRTAFSTRKIQSQIDRNCKDARHQEEETRQRMNEIVTGLEKLTVQLNAFKIVSETAVGGIQKQVTKEVNAKIEFQGSRIDTLSKSIDNAKKTAVDNSKMIQKVWRTWGIT